MISYLWKRRPQETAPDFLPRLETDTLQILYELAIGDFRDGLFAPRGAKRVTAQDLRWIADELKRRDLATD